MCIVTQINIIIMLLLLYYYLSLLAVIFSTCLSIIFIFISVLLLLGYWFIPHPDGCIWPYVNVLRSVVFVG